MSSESFKQQFAYKTMVWRVKKLFDQIVEKKRDINLQQALGIMDAWMSDPLTLSFTLKNHDEAIGFGILTNIKEQTADLHVFVDKENAREREMILHSLCDIIQWGFQVMDFQSIQLNVRGYEMRIDQSLREDGLRCFQKTIQGNVLKDAKTKVK